MPYVVDVTSVRVNGIILFQRKCDACGEKYFLSLSETQGLGCFVCELCPIPDKTTHKKSGFGGFRVVKRRNVVFSYKVRRTSRKNYKRVLQRDELVCQYCFSEGNTVDHIIPVVIGGSNEMHNLVTACSLCNSIASSMIFETLSQKRDYIMSVRKKN